MSDKPEAPARRWNHVKQRWEYFSESVAVHHIDGDPTNNDLSNLRIVPLKSKT